MNIESKGHRMNGIKMMTDSHHTEDKRDIKSIMINDYSSTNSRDPSIYR